MNDSRTRRRAAALVLPLLLSTLAACQSGGRDGKSAAATPSPSPTPIPVFSVRLDDQLSAASRATTATGSAAFTWTLRYGSAKGTAVERVTGVQDYAKDTARAERVVRIPRRFPADAARELGGEPAGARKPQTFAVSGNEVSYRTADGDWLRYSSAAPGEVVDLMDGALQRAGETAPYGGTLAEVVSVADASKAPVKGADGSRTYQVDVPLTYASVALPRALDISQDSARQAPGPIRTTVVLDRDGRLLRATADYAPALKPLHDAHLLKGVTSLRAEYTLSGHGRTPVPPPPAGGKSRDAAKVLTDVHKVKPGACASLDTGLGTLALVRVVPCGARADLRVFGQVRFKETVQGDPDGVAVREGQDRCKAAYRSAPRSWTADGRPADRFTTYGQGTTSSAYTGPDVDVEGDYTCLVETP
ncbi:hypothetical protein [Streptomyces sp. NBC_01268]|uniref:hypothetical protein n=1 Tax=Streptomyces sp. NBC_01268 TaxID=2903806 RepID=UPI002E322367|nr:hypothetical protein [Streptomyces sp. NBC_01268]